MIKIEIISANALKIIAPEKLNVDDFPKIAPQVDSVIRQYGKVRLLIDASGFKGWENIAAFENHAGFIKSHHQSIAVIATHDRQHSGPKAGAVHLMRIGLARDFVRPRVSAEQVFGKQTETVGMGNPI